MKHIFTKTQAVSLLNQFHQGNRSPNLFAPVETNHKYFNNSCEELETRLKKYIDEDMLSCVVDDPVLN